MKRTLLLGFAAALLSVAASAQAPDLAIQRAVLAAPANMRAEATVIQLQKDGTISVLRQGSNGLICWDNTGRPGYETPVDAECTVEANLPRLTEIHTWQSAGGTPEEIQARFDQAEAARTRKVSEYGSIYYRSRGPSLDAAAAHTNIAVPFATSESLGGIATRGGAGTMWLMNAGTSSAHLMVPGV